MDLVSHINKPCIFLEKYVIVDAPLESSDEETTDDRDIDDDEVCLYLNYVYF